MSLPAKRARAVIGVAQIAVLMEREAGRDLDGGGTVPLSDQRPPHW